MRPGTVTAINGVLSVKTDDKDHNLVLLDASSIQRRNTKQTFRLTNEHAEHLANALFDAIVRNEFRPHIDILDLHPRAKRLLLDAGVIINGDDIDEDITPG